MININTLTNKYIKASKTRNRLIVLTIILTTCLLTSIGILSNSIQNMFLKQVTDQTGTAHGIYRLVDSSTLESLKRHNKIEAVGEWIQLGNLSDENFNSFYLTLGYGDHAYMSMNNGELLKGNLPKNSNEIALEEWVFEKLNIEPKLREKISVMYTQSNENLNGEKVSYKGEGEFIVSGILKNNMHNKQYHVSTAIVSKAYIEENVLLENIERYAFVRVFKSRNIIESVYEIGRSFNLLDEQIIPQMQYISALGGDINSLIPFVIVALVIMIAASIVIYNIFYISIVQRINQFGLLSAVGATKKQLRKIVLKEGLILSFIGIPLGIILGHVLSYAILPLIQMNVEITISSSIYVVIGSAAISIITIVISLRKPSRVASKISPIEAIRYTGIESTVKRLERKSSGQLNLKKISHLNFWRNKKRTVLTILSLTMSGMLFIIFSSILSSMNVDNITEGYVNSDFQLTSNNLRHRDSGTDPLSKEVLEKINELDGIKDLSFLKFNTVYIEDENTKSSTEENEILLPNCDFFGFDDSLLENLKQYVIEGELSIDELRNNNYVFVEDREDSSQYKIGDKVKLEYYIGRKIDSKPIEKEFIIKGKVSKNPNWLGWSNAGGPPFITHEETFTREFGDNRIGRININFEKNKADKVEKTLKSIASSNNEVEYDSFRELKEKYQSSQRGLQIVSYSLLGIIGLIGIMNVINTMITSILSRRKEFGLLQAVGLTNKQLSKMLQIEGLYYAAISGILSILLGTSIGYLFFTKFKEEATYAIYKFPIVPILMVAFIFILLQMIITYLVKNKLNKDSIVDRIRYNE